MKDNRAVFFFDIDNCLYPKSKKVHDLMSDLIDEYFQTHLALSREDANELHRRYYRDYGLAIEGLVRHHKIDPLEYNASVDDALPLEDVLKPDLELRKLLEDIDKSKIKLWLFTNAYSTHGRRVVRLLGIEDLFEGLTFCDYAAYPFLCKPARGMFEKAMKEAGVDNPDKCYYIDDSGLNVRGGKAVGWKSVHLVEPDAPAPSQLLGDYQVASLTELRKVFPEVFT